MDSVSMEKLCFSIARNAQRAILYEAILTPKPGLVDATDKGAHSDMDIYTFIDSSVSLFEGFYRYAEAGVKCDNETILFEKIRKLGIMAEEEMFRATGGVNTHKGINFSMGIIVAATGYYLKKRYMSIIYEYKEEDTANIVSIIKKMTEGLVERDFNNLDKKGRLTNGERIYMEKGFSGIRGEAEQGFPTVINNSLPRLRTISKKGFSRERVLLDVLFFIMSITDDSNIINRGGFEALDFVKEQSTMVTEEGIIYLDDYKKRIEEVNSTFVKRNLSPGGAADLLSITLYFAFLENIF